MILVTTALHETVPKNTDEKVLLLGEWCKEYGNPAWNILDTETLDYHWNDRKALFEGANYTNDIYEKYLKILSRQLNKLHGEQRSVNYWRIVIGPWLIRFIQMVYDKYISIEKAFSENDINKTYVLNIKESELVPENMSDFNQLNANDYWNHFIYSRLIDNTKCDVICISHDNKVLHAKSSGNWIKCLVRRFSMALNKSNKIVFYDSCFNRGSCGRLQILLGQFPAFDYFTDPNPVSKYSKDKRSRLNFAIENPSPFEVLLQSLIKIQIPMSYVESYSALREISLRKYASNPKVIVTALAPSSFDGFKVWAACKMEGGAKLAYIQHGGYGSCLFDPQERHETIIADKFYSWGWHRAGFDNIQPMPSVKLINTIKYDSSGDILMPLMGARKYPSLLFSASLSSQFLGYINNQEDFLNLLPNKIRGLIKLRVFSEEYGWRMKDRLIDHELGGLIDNDKQLNKGFIKRLSGCRLCITTYNGTTHLETFSSNFPTLLFWNKEHWEINQDAQPYFDQLYRIGVLHYDVMSLANKVKEIYKDPMYWWQDDSIQRVISGFCNKFAYTEKDALNMWVSELQDLAKSASL